MVIPKFTLEENSLEPNKTLIKLFKKKKKKDFLKKNNKRNYNSQKKTGHLLKKVILKPLKKVLLRATKSAYSIINFLVVWASPFMIFNR